jgi:hypothetical protein
LDKVRIGLWLGMHQLDRNFEAIIPRFYVQDRIGRKDRMVILTYGRQKRKQLSFTGPVTLSFRFLPSAFGLIINTLCIVNISFDYFLARRLGFPYPRTRLISLGRMQGKRPDYCELGRGLHRVLRPIYLGPLRLIGTTYYQPMFSSEIALSTRSLYETQYVQMHSLDWAKGIGGLYFIREDRFGWLDERDTSQGASDILYSNSLEKDMALSVISALQYLNKHHAPDYSHHDRAEQQIIEARRTISLHELNTLQKLIRSWPEGRPVLGRATPG